MFVIRERLYARPVLFWKVDLFTSSGEEVGQYTSVCACAVPVELAQNENHSPWCFRRGAVYVRHRHSVCRRNLQTAVNLLDFSDTRKVQKLRILNAYAVPIILMKSKILIQVNFPEHL